MKQVDYPDDGPPTTTLAPPNMTEQLDFKAMAFMHDAPRFWHTRNIAVLASPDVAVKNDYIKGIAAFAIFLLSFFLLWALSIAFFKWRGVKRYGCLAGQVAHKKNDEDKQTAHNRFQIIQYVFIVAVIGVFIGIVMMLKRAVPFLDVAVTDILGLNREMLDALEYGQGAAKYTAEAVRSVHDPISEIRNVTVFPEYCTDQVAIDTFKIQSTVDDIVDYLSEVQDFLDKYEFEELEENLDVMVDRSHLVQDALTLYLENDWISKMYVLILGILSFFLCCYSMVTNWCNIAKEGAGFMTSYFLLPIFFVGTMGSWFLTVAFASGSAMNSDFCIGDGVIGPEATVQEAFNQYGIENEHIIFQSFLYYKSKCSSNNPFDSEVGSKVMNIHETINILGDFSNSTDITNACGSSVTPLLDNFENLLRELPKLLSGLEQGMDLARCERVLPLYERTFDGASCSESLRGLAWSFYAMFAISVCGIIIISLRSALYKIKAVHSDDIRENLEHMEHFDENIDWDEFTKNQVGNDWVQKEVKKKRSEDQTQVTYNNTDVEVEYYNDNEPLPISPTAQSNQSSIDTNECFDDDGVNSFNSELEPLTPSPTSMDTRKSFSFNDALSPSPSAPYLPSNQSIESDSKKSRKSSKSKKLDDTSIL